MMNHRDVCFVAAKEKYDFAYDAIKEYGFCELIPYKDRNVVLRILREIWFRLGLPFRNIWFNPEINNIKSNVIIVKDSLICKELLANIKQKYPKAKLVVMYVNRVHTTFPAEEAEKYADELWSYDESDCRKYNMRLMGDYYFEKYRIQPEEKKKTPAYDVVYLGRDKGRAEYLLELKKQFEELGLETWFRITPDRRYQRFKKKIYQPVISYQEYVEMLKDSRALLNIMPQGQTSITPRDMEVIFNSMKGITNNKGIRKKPYYHPDRYFIVGEDNIEELPDFLDRLCPEMEEDSLSEMFFDRMIFKMLT